SAEDALAAARASRPSLVLLDVRLPGVSGYEACRRLREWYGVELPIVFVSGDRVDPLDRVAGLLIGADDYLEKPITPDELLIRVRSRVQRAGEPDGRFGLTAREHEVLQLLASGQRQPEMALRLGIKPKTVGVHVERILRKLGVHSRAEAVGLAYREGLVDGDGNGASRRD